MTQIGTFKHRNNSFPFTRLCALETKCTHYNIWRAGLHQNQGFLCKSYAKVHNTVFCTHTIYNLYFKQKKINTNFLWHLFKFVGDHGKGLEDGVGRSGDGDYPLWAVALRNVDPCWALKAKQSGEIRKITQSDWIWPSFKVLPVAMSLSL